MPRWGNARDPWQPSASCSWTPTMCEPSSDSCTEASAHSTTAVVQCPFALRMQCCCSILLVEILGEGLTGVEDVVLNTMSVGHPWDAVYVINRDTLRYVSINPPANALQVMDIINGDKQMDGVLIRVSYEVSLSLCIHAASMEMAVETLTQSRYHQNHVLHVVLHFTPDDAVELVHALETRAKNVTNTHMPDQAVQYEHANGWVLVRGCHTYITRANSEGPSGHVFQRNTEDTETIHRLYIEFPEVERALLSQGWESTTEHSAKRRRKSRRSGQPTVAK